MADHHSGEPRAVELELPSDLDSVDTAENETLELAAKIGFEEDDLHKIGIAVRECLVNAVVHGNHYSARKKVRFQALPARDHLTIVVRDQGEGFEPQSLPDPLAQENLLRQSGRGMLLIQAFMDELKVETLASGGTEVRMKKYLAKASSIS